MGKCQTTLRAKHLQCYQRIVQHWPDLQTLDTARDRYLRPTVSDDRV